MVWSLAKMNEKSLGLVLFTKSENYASAKDLPKNAQILKTLSGTEMRYSWKKAEVKNTINIPVV